VRRQQTQEATVVLYCMLWNCEKILYFEYFVDLDALDATRRNSVYLDEFTHLVEIYSVYFDELRSLVVDFGRRNKLKYSISVFFRFRRTP
jgi:hypothetical protein